LKETCRDSQGEKGNSDCFAGGGEGMNNAIHESCREKKVTPVWEGKKADNHVAKSRPRQVGEGGRRC